MSDKELALLSKLLITGHLNVIERAELPNGMVRASKLRSLLRESLFSRGWFPSDKQLPTENAGGEYLQLEYKPNGGAILHINSETSYLQFSHKVQTFSSFENAIDTFIRERELHDLDGLKVDWSD